MASYKVVFKPSVEKDLRKLPKPVIARALDRIDRLSVEPRGVGIVKLSGAERTYRARVGDYRVVFEVDENRKELIVHYVRHRKDVYRDL